MLVYLSTAIAVLNDAMEISQELRMQKEVEGIEDRKRTIRHLQSAQGLQRLNERFPPAPAVRNAPVEGNIDDLEELFRILFLGDNQENR